MPLTDDAFMDTFEVLWGEHVDFGTSRSHKKLVGKKRGEGTEWRAAIEAKQKAARDAQPAAQPVTGAVDTEDSGKPQKRQKHQQQQKAQSSAVGGAQQKRALPNTGRFGGTLAAKLLGLT